jgi:hypothetical protein
MELNHQHKENQRKAGSKARQDGENVKNQLTSLLSYQGDDFNSYIINLLDYLNIDKDTVNSIHTKSHSDGRIKCAKSDFKVTISVNNNGIIMKIPKQISLKSTFASTQLSVHSVNSFEENLKNKNIFLPANVRKFLDYFTNSNTVKKYNKNPLFLCEKSKIRERFSLEEINNFEPNLYQETISFFEFYGKEILQFLISTGNEKNKENFAQLLAFCNKDLKNLLWIDIDKLIEVSLLKSKNNNTFCYPGKEQKEMGITTLKLYDGLVSVQMKGSGHGAAYHHLQFKISGNFIKKWLKEGFFNEI